jgi:hypothetical protein
MSANEKVYVIDPVPKIKIRGKGPWTGGADESAAGDGSSVAGAPRSASRRYDDLDRLDEKGSPALALLAFFAGPLSILATRRGKRSLFWIWTAIISCAAASAMAVRWSGVIPRAAHGFGLGSLLWLVASCLAIIAGFTAWARGVFLVGRWKYEPLRRLPAWIRHPAAVCSMGFLFPGFGLHAAGFPRRAACALWTVSLIAISIVVLAHSPAIWRWNLDAGSFTLPPDTLELAFIAIGALGLLGALVWIVQALDGARLAGRRTGVEPRPRGDLAAVALLVAIIAFIAWFQPADLAVSLDRFAIASSGEGLSVVPLHAAEAAMRLDPSRPVYALRAIEMNEALGRTERAGELRRDLVSRWGAYALPLWIGVSSIAP